MPRITLRALALTKWGVVVAILTPALLASPILAADPLAGIASVIDADTIELHGEARDMGQRL